LNASLAKNMLRWFGLSLQKRRRTPLEFQPLSVSSTQGKIIELLGAQGVGKTTLSNAIYSHLKSRWLFRHHVDFLPQKQPKAIAIGHLHRKIYFSKIKRIEATSPEPYRSLRLARQMSAVIYESLTISTSKFPRGFILDEGLFKNFPEEILELDLHESLPLWEPRILIHLRARNPDLVVQRYQERAKQRARGSFQHSISQDDIIKRVEESNRLYGLLIERAKEAQIPTITLYAEDDLRNLIKTILEFEKNFA
jgi:ABC-type dipeptide/oligopeptide/nickel transport system ATPase subunit